MKEQLIDELVLDERIFDQDYGVKNQTTFEKKKAVIMDKFNITMGQDEFKKMFSHPVE